MIAAARELKERLEALGLVAFCKTTGGKGLHVVTPLAPGKRSKVRWPEAKAFAQAVCAQMAEDSPDRYLLNMAKKQRTGRIFLDYLRNDRLSTAVAPLSPRLREGAPVSMPLRWPQVKAGLDPARYTVRTVPALIAKSKAWEDYCEAVRPLEPAIRKLVGPQSEAPARCSGDSCPRVNWNDASWKNCWSRGLDCSPRADCSHLLHAVLRRDRGHRQGRKRHPAARLREQARRARCAAPVAGPRRSRTRMVEGRPPAAGNRQDGLPHREFVFDAHRGSEGRASAVASRREQLLRDRAGSRVHGDRSLRARQHSVDRRGGAAHAA